MKKTLFILIGFLSALEGFAQVNPNNEDFSIDFATTMDEATMAKIEAVFTVMDAVEKTGAYIIAKFLA